MTQFSVLGRLRLLTPLDGDGAREALPFCAAAAAQLHAMRREETSGDDPRLDYAAACVAHYLLLLRQAGAEDGVASFKAGDITIKKQELTQRLALAQRLRDDALAEVSGLLRDTGFAALSTAFSPGGAQ
ncbi:MAG: hypothetical protein LBQ33_03770 [Oscillospiraceae bacterium]|jgi:hypothetical protein|nr:hypothetical protein [Oscillospiraceae bacterium]